MVAVELVVEVIVGPGPGEVVELVAAKVGVEGVGIEGVCAETGTTVESTTAIGRPNISTRRRFISKRYAKALERTALVIESFPFSGSYAHVSSLTLQKWRIAWVFQEIYSRDCWRVAGVSKCGGVRPHSHFVSGATCRPRYTFKPRVALPTGATCQPRYTFEPRAALPAGTTCHPGAAFKPGATYQPGATCQPRVTNPELLANLEPPELLANLSH